MLDNLSTSFKLWCILFQSLCPYQSSNHIFIVIYVDDINLFGLPRSDRNALKIALKSEFQLIELGTLNWLLRI